MLGDIENGTRRNNANCGMTPRVFEHLFARIQKASLCNLLLFGCLTCHVNFISYFLHYCLQEKEIRRDEKLRFTCKCSFLEIYNEQILDLLNPNSVNLQVSIMQGFSYTDLYCFLHLLLTLCLDHS
jgi:kinesin family protein 15